MNEGNSFEKESRQEVDLDQHLLAYYGPPLSEQPLASSSWQALRAQLPPRRSLRLWFRRRFSKRSNVPTFIQQAFTHIAYEARLPYTPAMLACSLKFHAHLPRVQVSLFRRHPIKLILPFHMAHSLEQAELDVLVATGLARYLHMRKPAYALSRLLLCGIPPLLCILLALLLQYRVPSLLFLLAIIFCVGLCVVALWLLHIQGRSMAFRADTLVVLWLGRSRACQGLHALAAHTPKPMHKRWSEPTLAERIERVCGIEVAVEQERLTLVR